MRARGSTVLFAMTALAACDSSPTNDTACPLPGELGRGAFRAFDCAGAFDCLRSDPLAAGAREQIIFCAYDDATIDDVATSDPARLRVDDWRPRPGVRQWELDVAALAPGLATIELRGPGLVERLTLEIEDIAAVMLQPPPRPVVAGGELGLASRKVGTSGRALLGRGGYPLTADPALATRQLGVDEYCPSWGRSGELYDVGVTGTEPRLYTVATGGVTPESRARVEVVPASAASVRALLGSTIERDGTGAFEAYVVPDGTAGLVCDWRTSRSVEIAPYRCGGAHLRMESDAPLDVTCVYDGRELATTQLTAGSPGE